MGKWKEGSVVDLYHPHLQSYHVVAMFYTFYR